VTERQGDVTTGGGAELLPPSFFDRPADVVARELLGALVVSTVGGARTAGRIVETEAYVGVDDPASHGHGGRRTARNAAMFGPPGTWYVYRIYGMHWCANVVTEREGVPSAVLLRALEPMEGIGAMQERRATSDVRALCAGPGRLCDALGLTRAIDGAEVGRAPAWLERGERVPSETVAATPRIGISRAADWPLRFVIRGSRWASRRG
jgi:DNA-3-methyladenine glycosylase